MTQISAVPTCDFFQCFKGTFHVAKERFLGSVVNTVNADADGLLNRGVEGHVNPVQALLVFGTLEGRHFGQGLCQHFLGQVPYEEIEREPVSLPDRVHNPDYLRNPVPAEMFVPDLY